VAAKRSKTPRYRAPVWERGNSEEVRVVQIDDEGNMVLQGMLHTELGPMPTIYNWPYKSGGGPHNE